jgi:hypothetical protein
VKPVRGLGTSLRETAKLRFARPADELERVVVPAAVVVGQNRDRSRKPMRHEGETPLRRTSWSDRNLNRPRNAALVHDRDRSGTLPLSECNWQLILPIRVPPRYNRLTACTLAAAIDTLWAFRTRTP